MGRQEGLPAASVANLDNIRTVARQWLEIRVGTISPSRHLEVKRALGYAIGWEELIDPKLRPSGG